ncbi:hypothetical protein Pcinc_039256 [Petrolisthes cinctipes]|uniref:Uncharacterized protein n=1 Tax=Petrolisthes cinctipes TaxID=88211 RepID=A0AAE1BNT3_PETCI|nr:hypothetical protein Pcinc_039256 [Petrolisthes cinctipes]
MEEAKKYIRNRNYFQVVFQASGGQGRREARDGPLVVRMATLRSCGGGGQKEALRSGEVVGKGERSDGGGAPEYKLPSLVPGHTKVLFVTRRCRGEKGGVEEKGGIKEKGCREGKYEKGGMLGSAFQGLP